MQYNSKIQLNNQETLHLRWDGNYDNLVLTHKNKDLDSPLSHDELVAGVNFVVDKKFDELYLIFRDNNLEIWQDGIDLLSGKSDLGSGSFDTAWKLLYVMVIYNLIYGFAIIYMASVIPYYLIFAALFLVLAIWAYKKQAKLPLFLGTGLIVLQIFTIIISTESFNGCIFLMIIASFIFKGTTGHTVKTVKTVEITENSPLDQGLD